MWGESLKLKIVRRGHDIEAFVSGDNGETLFTVWLRNPLQSYGPGVTVSLTQSFLDRVGDLEAVRRVREWLYENLGQYLSVEELVDSEQVSYAEIKADLLVKSGSICDLRTADAKLWLSRLTPSHEAPTFRFGDDARLGIRAYDKLGQTGQRGAERLTRNWNIPGLEFRDGDLWHDNTALRVSRFECQFGRRWLREHGVDTYEDLIDAVPGLVVKAIDRAKLMEPTKKGNRSRRPNPVWSHLRAEAEEEFKLHEQSKFDVIVLTLADEGETGEPFYSTDRRGRSRGYCGRDYVNEPDTETEFDPIVAAEIRATQRMLDREQIDACRASRSDGGLPPIPHNAGEETGAVEPPAKPRRNIPLQNSDLVAIVDKEDYDRVMAFSRHWHKQGEDHTVYVEANYRKEDGSQGNMPIHRLILDAPEGMVVDHLNHCGLDNRKENLRLCTPRQNNHNSRGHKNSSSRYKGVSKKGNRWRADYEGIYIGTFDTEEEAAYMYQLFASAADSEFALRQDLPMMFLLGLPHSFSYTHTYTPYLGRVTDKAREYITQFPIGKQLRWDNCVAARS